MHRYMLALVVALSFTCGASAQYSFGNGCFGPPGLRFAYSNRNISISGYVSPAFGYRYYSPYAFSPYVLPAGFMSNTVIITQPQVLSPINPAAMLPNLPTVPPLEEREDVIIIRPKAGGVRNLPPVREGVVKPDRVKPFDPPPLIAPRAERGPAAESARQLQLGKEAFSKGEYGRALERFSQASRLAPNDAMTYFLKAQAEMALGKYAEAVASITAGMKQRPDWPREKFNPREVYGRNPAEALLHLDQLRQAVAANPNEPTLLFLYGYHLWFDGRRVEAKEQFKKALPLVTDPKLLELFLQEPDGPVAAR